MIVVPFLAFGAFTGSTLSIGVALSAAGLCFVAKQHLRYPSGAQPVDEVAGLLDRLDASPMAGIAVEVRGRIIGRGFPGYVLSPDLPPSFGKGSRIWKAHRAAHRKQQGWAIKRDCSY